MLDMRTMAATEAVRRVMHKGTATYWEIAIAALQAADSVAARTPEPRTSDMTSVVEAIREGRATPPAITR